MTATPAGDVRKADGGPVDWREELRRYISANVIGDNPPPVTAEAQALIRAALGPHQAGETSSTA